MIDCYSELIQIPTFEERLECLRTRSSVGKETFGEVNRYLNQLIYRNNQKWKSIRSRVITRDNGCDLGCSDHPIGDRPAIVHHIIPITLEMIEQHDPLIFDPENLITTILLTHNLIHFGTDESIKAISMIERKPNDTCPWRR